MSQPTGALQVNFKDDLPTNKRELGIFQLLLRNEYIMAKCITKKCMLDKRAAPIDANSLIVPAYDLEATDLPNVASCIAENVDKISMCFGSQCEVLLENELVDAAVL